MRLPQKLCLALAALSLAQAGYYYSRMPPVVASHFDGAGVPNGWSSPGGFFTIVLLVVALNVLIFVGVPRGLRAERLVNLSHRDYWLAPQRRRRTLERIGDFLGWFGVASLLMAVTVVQMVVHANLTRTTLSDTVVWVLLAYLAYVAGSLLWLYLVFRKPTGGQIDSA